MAVAGLMRWIGFTAGLVVSALDRQEQDNWCWAACASGISRSYDSLSAWTQCAVANATLARTTCCDQPAGCDQPWWVHRALERTGNLALRHANPLSEREVRRELRRRRPIVVRVQFPQTGHFVVIDG